MLEDLEAEETKYKSAGEFLARIKGEFGEEDKEAVKVVELKRIEQGGRTIEEFVQEFKRAARRSGYEGRPLVKKFKRRMNRIIKRKLIKTERLSTSIEQWYKHITNLDRC